MRKEESLIRLMRYLRIGKPRHHITVHSNGRCFLRASAVKRLRLSSFVSLSVTMGEADALLVFYPDGSGSCMLIHPVRSNGTVCSSFYFYSRKIAVRAASMRVNRFRIAGQGEWGERGSYRLRVKLEEVKDLYCIMNNKK